MTDGLNSIETLSERAGMRPNAAIIDLTNPSILATKLEESFIEYVNSYLNSRTGTRVLEKKTFFLLI